MSATATAWPRATDMPEAAAPPPAGEGSLLSKFGSGRTPDGTRLIRAFGLSRLEVAQLAATDFPNPDLPFRRVSIDPVRGAAVMMAPSRLHERIAVRLDKVAEGLGGGVPGGGRRVEQLRGARWRDREGPQGAGAEADCAFYVGEKAEAYLRAEASGDEQADAFAERHPPDLVAEINVSHTDEGKPVWYRRLGVTELWAVAAGKSPDWLEVEFLDLQAPGGVAASRESKVIPRAQPADVKDGLRMLQDVSLPVMEGPRRIASAFAQRLVQRTIRRRGLLTNEEGGMPQRRRLGRPKANSAAMTPFTLRKVSRFFVNGEEVPCFSTANGKPSPETAGASLPRRV